MAPLAPKQILHLANLVRGGLESLHSSCPAVFDAFMFLQEAQSAVWKEFGTAEHTPERTISSALQEIWQKEINFKAHYPYQLGPDNSMFLIGPNNLLSLKKIDQYTGEQIEIKINQK